MKSERFRRRTENNGNRGWLAVCLAVIAAATVAAALFVV